MFIKYKNEVYSDQDVPLFIYFGTDENRREFMTILNNSKPEEYFKANCVYGIMAGSKMIKDKRSQILIRIDEPEEKKQLQKRLYESPTGSNAVITTPPDIGSDVIIKWVRDNIEKISMK